MVAEPTPAPGAAAPRRRRVAVAAAGAALLVLAVATGFLLLGDEGEAAALSANSLGRLDTGNARIKEDIRVGADPADVVAGGGSLLVVN